MNKAVPITVVSLVLASLALGLLAPLGEAVAGECRIGWHPRGKGLFTVYKDGLPYKGRAYIAHDDVVNLRKYLASSGDCDKGKVQERERCSIRKTGNGAFQVHFAAQPLYANESHRSQVSASERMEKLVRMGFCQSAPKPEGQ